MQDTVLSAGDMTSSGVASGERKSSRQQTSSHVSKGSEAENLTVTTFDKLHERNDARTCKTTHTPLYDILSRTHARHELLTSLQCANAALRA